MPRKAARSTSNRASMGYRRTAKRRPAHVLGKPRKDLTVCKTCGIYFAGKRWLHSTEAKRFKEETPVQFTTCPACRMRQDGTFEGELIARQLPSGKKQGMLATIRNMGDRAYARDPLERILRIEDSAEGIRVLTSENQLAVRIGRELKQTFKGTLRIRWSKDDEVTRVLWQGSGA